MRQSFTIVVADDDVDDQELMKKGLDQSRVPIKLIQVYDGLKLMDYLLKREQFKNTTGQPDLILLDLNMPLMDGFEVLSEIRKYPSLAKIPLYVITTSKSKHEMAKVIELGATGFYSKGASSRDIIDIMKKICVECFA